MRSEASVEARRAGGFSRAGAYAGPMDAVLFDLDGTLCEYRRHGRAVLAVAFERAGVEPCFTVEDYHRRYGDFLDVADTVDGQREACFAALADEAGGDPARGRAVARAFAAERDHGDVAFLDGAAAALEALADGHALGLVTNGAPDMQARKLDALGLRERFDAVVHGGYDAPAKPAPEPFHRALETLGVAPDRAVHVGNSLEADVAGARSAGLGSVWLRDGEPAGDVVPDYAVDSLAELVDPPWR